MMPAALPRIGRAVICNGKSAAKNVEKLNIKSIAVNSAPRNYCQSSFVLKLDVFFAL